MTPRRFFAGEDGAEEHWISVADLMAGLVILFLFISIGYMKEVVVERDGMRNVAADWKGAQGALYDDLRREFRDDLLLWHASLDRDNLAVRFHAPEILFGAGSATLKPAFRRILADFFPRYLRVLDSYRGAISEVRIEGHTSTEWAPGTNRDDAYFHNMKLSQDRARAVLEYAVRLPQAAVHKEWAIRTITANGLSWSRRIMTDGREDKARSRRVEFRVVLNAGRPLDRILQAR